MLNGVDPNVAASALTHEIGHAARLHAERLAERGDRTLLDAMDKVVADAPDALKRLLVACRESDLRSTPSTVYYRPPHYWRRHLCWRGVAGCNETFMRHQCRTA